MAVPIQSDSVTLYRVMCDAEFVQLTACGHFLLGPGSVEGKYFAETPEHAKQWGIWFQKRTGVPHDRIIAIKVRREVVAEMFRFPMLDGIGPAVFATMDQLSAVVEIEVVR